MRPVVKVRQKNLIQEQYACSMPSRSVGNAGCTRRMTPFNNTPVLRDYVGFRT